MKKALAILSAVALVGGAAFADAGISWGAWGRGVFVPVQSSDGGTTTTAATEASWGGNPRVGFGIHGKADQVGFDVDLTGDVKEVGIGDNAKIWVKPVEQIKFSIGKVQGDALRGKISDSSFARYVGSSGNEDSIFLRFYPGNSTGNPAGALVEITPMEGVFIGAAVEPSKDATKAEDVYAKVQVGAGYTIAGIGQIRAQYIGNSGKATTTASNAAAAQVAFALTAVEGLTVDVGAKIPFATKVTEAGVDYSYQDAFGISAGANFGKDALGLFARVDATMGGVTKVGTVETKANTVVNAYIVPSYNLDFATLGCDVAIGASLPSSGDSVVSYGFGPYLEKGLGNGKIKGGVAVKGNTVKDSKIGFAVPVLLEYWF